MVDAALDDSTIDKIDILIDGADTECSRTCEWCSSKDQTKSHNTSINSTYWTVLCQACRKETDDKKEEIISTCCICKSREEITRHSSHKYLCPKCISDENEKIRIESITCSTCKKIDETDVKHRERHSCILYCSKCFSEKIYPCILCGEKKKDTQSRRTIIKNGGGLIDLLVCVTFAIHL